MAISLDNDQGNTMYEGDRVMVHNVEVVWRGDHWKCRSCMCRGTTICVHEQDADLAVDGKYNSR